jgi:acyl carrier protein
VSLAFADDVRATLLEACATDLAALGLDPAALGDDFDLRAGGVVDSLGFLELITALEDRFGMEIDFEALPPEELTVLGPLVRHVAVQVADASAVSG